MRRRRDTADHHLQAQESEAFGPNVVNRIAGHDGCVQSAVFSADGSCVLTASSDCTAKLGDASTGECQRTLAGQDDVVLSAVFSADGSSALTASDDGTTKIWDVSTGECQQTLAGHIGSVNSVVFSS